MSKIIELVEQMRGRMVEMTTAEHELVRALGETLDQVDQKLLQDVRDLANGHDERRSQILDELQGLAVRLGSFPAARQVAPGLPFAEPPPPTQITHANGNHPAYGGADWREATSNIEDELDQFCKQAATS